jgi:hypothetical protein
MYGTKVSDWRVALARVGGCGCVAAAVVLGWSPEGARARESTRATAEPVSVAGEGGKHQTNCARERQLAAYATDSVRFEVQRGYRHPQGTQIGRE